MDWRTKGLLQKVLGVMPGGDAIHYQLQRRFGGLRDFDREFDIKIDDWRLMANQLREVGVPMAGARLFEIGSGWYPTFPLCCFLAGAQRVVTVDLNRHLRRDLLRACARGLERHVALIAEVAGVAEAEVRQRQQQLAAALERSADLAAATAGVVDYRAPADAARTDLPPDHIDGVFSNSVLEHVAPEAIGGIFGEAMRILRPHHPAELPAVSGRAMAAVEQRLPVPEPAARRRLRRVRRGGRFRHRDPGDLAAGPAPARAGGAEDRPAIRLDPGRAPVHHLDRLHCAQTGGLNRVRGPAGRPGGA